MSSKRVDKKLSMPNIGLVKEIYNLKPHPRTGRLIDSHPGKRTREMSVLCLGASRTGSMSIYTALNKLGFKVYHMSEAMKTPKTSFGCWIEAIKAKYYGQGAKFKQAEFDKLLGDFDAGADVPFAVFGVDLIEAYPEAKVLLNTRDVDPWLKSMNKTAGRVLAWPTWPWVAPWDPALVGPWWEFAQWIMPVSYRTMTDFSPEGPARQAFLEHYQQIRDATPKDRLLEYRVEQGWEPLCKFLDLPVPDEPFPRINDSDDFVRVHAFIWYLALGKMVLKVSAVAVPVAAIGLAYWKDWLPQGFPSGLVRR